MIQVEGNLAGAGDALMLDCDGFVSETNATNIVSVHVLCNSSMFLLQHVCLSSRENQTRV